LAEVYGGGITLPKSIMDAQVKDLKEPEPIMIAPAPTAEEPPGTKVWFTPILKRVNLENHLNELSGNKIEIFQILPLDRETVQVVCFAVVRDKDTSSEE
jgi:hypothetical protein